jgi:hypothetical protein
MAVNKIILHTIGLPNGETLEMIDVKSWEQDGRIYVAAFDLNDNQVSRSYSEEVDPAGNSRKKAVMASLAKDVVFDLATNPELHYRSSPK